MSKTENKFLVAIDASFEAYNEKGGARSNKKLIPAHKFIAKTIARKIGQNFSVKSLGVDDVKEARFSGKYYDKKLDVAICKSSKIIATVSFKFVTSNYKQNVNNYFEQLMGETANIRRLNVGFAHLLVLRGHTPYYLKDKGNARGQQAKIEVIKEKDLQKYVKLYQDLDFPHRPDLIGICVLGFGKNNKSRFVDLDDFDFSDKTKRLLKNDFSLDIFLEKFVHLVKLKG
jgi:hypothetical protein